MNEQQKSTEIAKPSYWAVLPAAVRYDPALPANAKLLYAEISSLTDGRGFCWASNAYFERLYDLSERTIIRLIRALEAAGYIRIEDADGGAATRKIYAGVNPMGTDSHASAAAPARNDGETETPDKNVSTPRQKCQGGGDKNVTHNKKENKKENSPPKAPQGASVSASTPKWKPERFEAFWRYYPAIPDGNGHGRRPAKDRAARAWDKLHADDSEIDLMAAALQRQKASRQWRDGVGIPYASTWLNSRAWREEVEDLDPAAGLDGRPCGADDREEALPWI